MSLADVGTFPPLWVHPRIFSPRIVNPQDYLPEGWNFLGGEVFRGEFATTVKNPGVKILGLKIRGWTWQGCEKSGGVNLPKGWKCRKNWWEKSGGETTKGWTIRIPSLAKARPGSRSMAVIKVRPGYLVLTIPVCFSGFHLGPGWD